MALIASPIWVLRDSLVGRVSQNDGSGWSDRFALSFVYAVCIVECLSGLDPCNLADASY